MSRPYPHAYRNSTENVCFKFHGLGKSSLMIYEKWGNMKYKYRNRQFWCRGYYVDTVGKNTKKIQEYIQNQLNQDKETDQLLLDLNDPFATK